METPSTESGNIDLGRRADDVYRRLLTQYIEIYEKDSWSLTLAAVAVGVFLASNKEKISPIVGYGNTVITIVALGVIALVGLMLKAIQNRISKQLKFTLPHAESAEELQAVRNFSTSLKTIVELLLEKCFPKRAARVAQLSLPKDVHEEWKPFLWLVGIANHLTIVRNLAIIASVWSFAVGTVKAIEGHDRSLNEIKKQANEIISSYETDKVDRLKLIGELNASNSTLKESASKNQQIADLRQKQLQILAKALIGVLTLQKDAFERAKSPEGDAAAKEMEKGIESLREDYLNTPPVSSDPNPPGASKK